jgi:hypothetical protein
LLKECMYVDDDAWIECRNLSIWLTSELQ